MSDSILMKGTRLIRMNFFSNIFFSHLVDDMGRRIDDLERNIAHIVSLSNAESP